MIIRKTIFFLIPFLGFAISTIAQPKSQANLQFKNVSYSTYIIKIDSSIQKKLNIIPNYVNLNHKEFIEENISNIDPDIFAINACVRNDNGAPIGLLVAKKKEINTLNTNDGSGNFFLKPNGVFVITEKDVAIVESSKFHKYSKIINAVQSGPMLVIDDSIHSAFNPTSKNSNIRCGVGIFKENQSRYLVFAISNEPVTFYDFASLFKNRFNCSNALCLESTNSVMYSKELGINKNSEEKIVGNYIVYNPNGALPQKPNVVNMNRSRSGIYEIPVELNQVLKISFIFDSGASDVSISPDVALTLIRTGTIKEADFIGTQVYSFADGSTAQSDVFILHDVKIGNRLIKNVRASISNSIDAPMLLGQSVLQRLGKFSVDNSNHTLVIE